VALGIFAVCGFLLFNWKEWHLHVFTSDFTIHFPRFVALSLIEAGVAMLARLHVNQLYKWGIAVMAASVAIAISVDTKPKILVDRPYLEVPILIAWAAGLLAFLFCMTWLFQQMGLPKFRRRWRLATIVLIIVYVYSALFQIGNVLHLNLPEVLLTINGLLLGISGLSIVDMTIETIFGKWQ